MICWTPGYGAPGVEGYSAWFVTDKAREAIERRQASWVSTPASLLLSSMATFLNPKAFTPLSENDSSTVPRSQRINMGALSAALFPTMSHIPHAIGFTPFLCPFHFTRNLLATILSWAAWRHRCHQIINLWYWPCFLKVPARLSGLRITDSTCHQSPARVRRN